jgi:tyrosyl-tRNA synthetase
MPLFALLRLAELCGSSSEARRLIRGGGAYIGTERVVDENRSVTAADFTDGMLMLRAGKKNVRRIVLG